MGDLSLRRIERSNETCTRTLGPAQPLLRCAHHVTTGQTPGESFHFEDR